MTWLLSVSPEEQMLRAAVLPQDVLAGGLLTNLQSAAVLRQGVSGRIFSLKTQEQPDLQTVALGVLPGSGHPPRAARRPDRPHRKGPNQGPQGSHAPWNREFLPHGGARSCPGLVIEHVGAVSAAAEQRTEMQRGDGGRPEVEGQAEGVGADGPGLCRLSTELSAPTAGPA